MTRSLPRNSMFLKTSSLSWFNWHTTWSVLCKCHHITTLTRLSFHEAFRTVLNIIWCTHRAESIRTAGADALSRVVHIFTTDLVRRLTANSRAWICLEKVLQGSCRKFNGFNFFTSRNERKLISSYKIVNYLVKGEKSKSKKKVSKSYRLNDCEYMEGICINCWLMNDYD